MFEIFIKWALPFFCAGLCSVMAAVIRRSHSKNKCIAQGMQCLLRLEIIRSYENYMGKGKCPVYAREAISRGYTAYHNLGGNDVATDLYDKIMELPTK